MQRFIRSATFLTSAFAFAIFTLTASSAFAFTYHRATSGPLTFEISKIPALTVEGQIYKAPLIVENASDAPISIRLKYSTLETVYLYDDAQKEIIAPNAVEKTFVVDAKSRFESTIPFAVRGAYRDAHYPIRANFTFELDGAEKTVELVPVFATKLTEFLPTSKEMKTLDFGGRDFLKLVESTDYAAYWRRDGGEHSPLATGWSGSETESKASFNLCSMTRGGVQRAAWSVHPPYDGGPGVVGVRYAVSLPQAKSLELRFFRAMRDVFPPEPPTDGVVYRVFAEPIPADCDAATLSQLAQKQPLPSTLVFEELGAQTSWLEANVDLSKFAGQKVLLTFETDPGAKRDTTCDGSFWGDVALVANPSNETLLTASERERLQRVNAESFAAFLKLNAQKLPSAGVPLSFGGVASQGFEFGDGQFAVVTPGKHGVCDGFVTIGNAAKSVQIDGVRARYQGVNVGFERPFAACDVSLRFVDAANSADEARRFLDANAGKNALCCFVSRSVGGLAFRWVATKRNEIERLDFGPFSQKAPRVYFGHGYCIVEPKAFEFDGDGFACSTSHVAFEFANGLALLQATTAPVDRLVVDPERCIYTLATRPDSTLTLRSSELGAFDCARKYAPGFDKVAAPLVPKKAGRFVYDYWGGSYRGVLDRMKTFVDYGLTDSLLVQHVWQRHGYDVRLPDIWPPRPEQGTLDDLKETQAFCDKHGIPFGLHDNYIDFYPDADGFNYDDIIMNPDGQPQKAWYNPGPDVQSYRFNPTAIFPYAERNLALIKPELKQTAYFTDVFSSIYIMDFYDRQGNFHSRAETLDCWNRYFDLVRKTFDDNAITISESGSDALIGHLDGADAILRRITKNQENYTGVIDCADYEYVPWFDAVNHNRFILHGVGYSSRYEGGVSRSLRGIESDDYLSSEALTGHALMVDLSTSDRGTVRKYWLMQNLARSLAMDEIVDFEFVDGDIHRQKIAWKSGVVVYVNRGANDWQIGTYPNSKRPLILPRFGFWATNDKASFGGVVRLDGQVVEIRVDDGYYFVNGRQKLSHEATPIRPLLDDVKIVDNQELRGKLSWDALRPTAKPYAPFLHLERPKTWWADKPELHVLPLADPKKPTDRWQGLETQLFGDEIAVPLPSDLPPGKYDLLTGLYDREGDGKRLTLLGFGTDDQRYKLGMIVVEGQGANRRATFEPTGAPDLIDLRLIPNVKASDFGVCETLGAFRCEQISESTARLTPLPNEPKFDVRLTTPFFADGTFDVVLRDRNGDEIGRYEAQSADGALALTVDAAQAFALEIVKK